MRITISSYCNVFSLMFCLVVIFVVLVGVQAAQDVPSSQSQARKEISFNRHSTPVESVAFSPNGLRIASAGRDRVKLTDIATGKELFAIKNEKNMTIQAIAYAPDGKTLAVGQMTAKTSKRTRQGQYTVSTIFFQGNILLCDAETGTIKAVLNNDNNPVWALAYAPDGRWLAMGTGPTVPPGGCTENCEGVGEIVLWDVVTAKPVRRLRGNASAIQTVTFSPDSRWVAGGGSSLQSRNAANPNEEDPLEAYVWNVETGELAQRLTGQRTTITSLAFSPDGRWLATAARNRSLKIWNTQTWKVECEASDYLISYDELITARDSSAAKKAKDRIPPQSWLNAIAFSPDSQLILGGSGDALVRIYAANTAKLMKFIKPRDWPIYTIDRMMCGRLHMPGDIPDASVNGNRMPTMGPMMGPMRPPTQMPPSFNANNGMLDALALSPDGKTLALGTADGKVRLLPWE